MSREIEFFFDYGSPYSYLANHVLDGVAKRTGAEIVYRPFLLGGVFKATGNQSPAMETIEAKRNYGGATLQRWAAHHGAPFHGNPHFPINTLGLMRMANAAQQRDEFSVFHAAIYPAFWVEGLNLGEPNVVAQVLAKAGLDASALAAAAGGDDAKAALRAHTDTAVARGAFGAPTCFVGDEMFFGADHLVFLEAALKENA